ncbi:MAG: HNH endonuclease [Nitrospira sp.]|nr:HNH endonuclease [Nitrospira sp.]MDE0505175.1 HNH endonuclease [Candidatus Poribacteria bacterium]
MAFSKEVKQKSLVRAARHCCVCHRYKGVNVEVHHIVPHSDGGNDHLDNAIALCFDCHANAGHYNTNHPKGTAYSPSELRKAREVWHDLVRSGVADSPPVSSDWAYCRYIVCKNFSVLSEIVRGDFSRIPAPAPLLTENIALEEMRRLVQIHETDTRGSSVDGDMFADVARYRAKHPGVHVFEESDYPHYPYFRTFRTPDENEIRKRVVPSDPVSGYLLDAGAPPEDVCLAVGYDELCGGGGFQELYKTRPLWAAFLEVRNMDEAAVTFRALQGELSVVEPRYRGLAASSGETWSTPLPSAPILPGQSVLVPLATLLGPLEQNLPLPHSSDVSALDVGQYQEVDRVDYSNLVTDVRVIGPMIWPSSVLAESHGAPLTQELHGFDLSNLYTIDRHWAMGSCPHLFFRYRDGRIRYAREIFSESPAVQHCYQLTVPEGIKGVILAELEREITYIDLMSVNGRSRIVERELRHGEFLEVSVTANDEIQIVGWYCPELIGRQDPLYQNQLIYHFIEDQTSDLQCT